MEGVNLVVDSEKAMLKEPLLGMKNVDKGTVDLIDVGERLPWVWTPLWVEIKRQLQIAVPMVLMNLLQSSLQLVSLMFVGHLGELALSSASVASSIANVTGFSVLLGMGCALETLCGQAYGAKKYKMLGVYLQRAMVTLLIVSVPLSLTWMNLDHILLALGQDPAISYEAGIYSKWLCPSLFAYAFLQPMGKYLQTQSNILPMMLCAAFTLLLHVPLCWLLVLKIGLGTKGAAIAINISYWFNTLLLFLYILFSSTCKETRAPLSREAFHDIKGFLKLAIPSAVMICLEWWSFEVLVLLSGLLPNPQLEMSVLSICLSTSSFAYMIPYGLGAAASTRVSNELGAGHTRGVRLAVRAVIGMSITESMVRATILLSVRNIWGRAYSNEPEVIIYMARMMPILAASTIMDGLQGVMSGIARGCGQQNLGAYANLAAYYIVGIPSAAVLAFVLHLGAMGLWLGILCGLLTQTLLLALITIYTDWNEQLKKAMARVYTSPLLGNGLETVQVLH